LNSERIIANSALTIAIMGEGHYARRVLKAIALRIGFSEATGLRAHADAMRHGPGLKSVIRKLHAE